MRIFLRGKLAGIVALYMVAIHWHSEHFAKYLPKEVSVGILFAVGTTLPLWSRLQTLTWTTLASWISFALLCVLNCTAIECRERPHDQTSMHPLPHPLVRSANQHIGRLALVVAFLSIVPAFLPATAPSARAFVAVSAAALFLFVIDCCRTKLSTEALRVLADIALVLPVLLILGLRT